ncbi:ran-binding protein 3 [Rhynchophorus ferrugineus]|uniref:RanBD1 domain-containing protein n=1 Tax=Rhynchophorus ferrugineus TaxID=354439 RepID=A0A834MBZ1_RHYFE|nr:hypothetical protein GWI33_007559 [Rhynchophorus ferrugineus]
MADVESKDKESLKPTVIMKVEAPTGDRGEKQDSANDVTGEEEEFKVCSPSNVVKSTSTNPFASSDSTKLSKSILKPSQLVVKTTSPIPGKPVIKQSSFNPFIKVSPENKSDTSDKNQNNGEVKFVPLIKSDSQNSKPVVEVKPANPAPIPAPVAAPTFVFGQNLQDRVIGSEGKSPEPTPSTSLSSNGTSDMLFSAAIKSEGKTDIVKEKESKSLTESAREYEESRANKRKYEEVEVRTGEEDETNILSISCKLFTFDKVTSNWQERGRGTLRLNDFENTDGHIGSRLVFRTTGSLRVILNTKIWAEMTVDKANEKSIRLTALDSNGEIKVFLIMSSKEDSKHLYTHLQQRLEKEVSVQKRKKMDTGPSQK